MPSFSHADDFLDTRITWTYADDDVLTPTAETAPPSPLPRVGDRDGLELFFDNLDTRYSGRESVGHLVLSGRAPGYVERVSTEASLVALLVWRLETAEINLYDDGSFLRVAYALDESRPDDELSLTLFPFTTNRFRLGYLYDLSWGDDAIFTNDAKEPAPGLKMQIDRGPWSAFVGMKTTIIAEPQEVVSGESDVDLVTVDETQYGALGGVGWEATPMLRLDLGGGYFQQGSFDQAGVRGLPMYTLGGSARVVVHDGIDVGTSADFRLYRNDPDYPFALAAPEEYVPGKLSWALSVEGAWLEQHLEDPDAFGSTLLQPAPAAALQLRVKYGYNRIVLTGFFRSLEFLLRNVPSFVPRQGIPPEAEVEPDLFGAIAFDRHFPRTHLTPGFIVGVQLPATFTSISPTGSLGASRTLVIREEGDVDILPVGDDAVPIVGARANLRWDLSELLAGNLFVQYVHDANATRLVADPSSGTRRIYSRQDQLGAGLTVQARY